MVSALITKLLYDISVLYLLPETYLVGMTYNVSFSNDKAILGWIVYILMIFLFCRKNLKNEGNLNLCMYILWFLYYIPMNSAYAINDMNLMFLLLTTIYWGVLVFFSETKFTIGKRKIYENNVKSLPMRDVFDNKIATILFIGIDILCIIYVFQYNGFSLTLNIQNVYDARASFVGTTTIFESILFNFGGNIIIPISMIYGFDRKNYLLFVLGVFGQLGIFSVAMQKGNLLVILIIILVIILKKWNLLEKVKSLVAVGIPLFFLVCFIENWICGSNALFMLFIRRLFYIPAWLNSIYYQFFSENKLLLFSQDVFLVERLGFARYDKSVLDLINQQFFGGYMASPNTGMFAEAFMHLGIIGILVFPIIWISFLRHIFKYTLYYERNIQIFFVIYMALTVTNLPCTSGIFCVTFLFFIPFTMVIVHFVINLKK